MAWGAMVGVVVLGVVAAIWAWLRRTAADRGQAAAQETARIDAVVASAARQEAARTVAAAAQPEAQAQAAVGQPGGKVDFAADAKRLAGDLKAQADVVAGMICAPKTPPETPK